MRKAVFLDRDGTLIVEKDYLKNPEEVVLERGVPQALGRLAKAGFLLVVITNQSGIGRGIFGEADFLAVQRRMDELLAAHGVRLDGTFHCPHRPEDGCDCRKPKPGMILDAMAAFGVEPKQSFMVGDKAVDVEAGKNAGVRTVLVRTGYGKEFSGEKPDFIAKDLPDAVETFILGRKEK
jgi:D-glycero-D-manno-heptose 1,7-bisphosphate phosphatase